MKISCSVGSVEWLGDRGEQDDRGRGKGPRKENGTRGGVEGVKE